MNLPYDLTDEEHELLEAYDNDEFVSLPDFEKRKQQLQEYAKNTLDKKRNINIRLSEQDLHRLKVKAIEEGIPYQTLATSILHKAVSK
jgi:predicted DNA binding CopG/RHH family protein